jgi:hypothetical protein
VAATTTERAEQAFVTVSGDRRSEVARTLAEPVPASILSFAVAAAVTVAAGLLHRWRRA